MRIYVNGEQRTLPDGAAVTALAEALDLPDEGVAIAVDGDMVPRSAWGRTPLPPGADVDVLAAVQGG